MQNLVLWIVLAVIVLFCALFAAIFARLFTLWMKSTLSGATISLPQLMLMSLPKIPPQEIVPLRIMAVQAGVDVGVHQLQQAYLMGVDLERAVLAMIRAKETGRNVHWEDVIHADVDQRLDDRMNG
ncbi:MAG: flotillin-like FloA family protein [Planctomycetes bacterium]|nr:flotillin-like FloA family protein [Planctomycetota bacterium]